MAKEFYKCEKCGLEFEDRYDCIFHESECLKEQDIININYEKALKRLKEKYNIKITRNYAILRIDECDGYIMKFIQIGLQGSLPNGHIIDDDDPYFNMDTIEDVSEDIFYHYIESKLILPYLDTRYEGKIFSGYCDWGHKYIIGETEVNEICRRFMGKKVRIEVI